ncbi:MAG: FHA domain-containing protein [Lachnospiraceae bacterium]|nr:FHA domain-containing protein [Lachnospiraceae bacterium]
MENDKLQSDILETEYVRNLNCNYERVRLEEKPKENRYQYCILNRGGIRFLLPCSLRYIDGDAFLYYDISSTQSIVQLFEGKSIGREWMRDFLWGMERMQQELGRYLLEDRNVIWSPEHIYQDLEKNDFFFMYIPYCGRNRGFKTLLDFWVEHIDYEDEALVEFVYGLHEQYAAAGDTCLNRQIYENFKEVEKKEKRRRKTEQQEREQDIRQIYAQEPPQDPAVSQTTSPAAGSETEDRRKGFLSFLGGRRKKQDAISYQEILQRQVSMQALGAVSEETVYGEEEEEYGRTVYLEEQQKEQPRGLYRDNGELAVKIDKFPFVIGKKKDEVDYVLEERSVSRIHARILEEDGRIYLEDLNSTNGTFKNGLRMQPYEKRRLEKDDELRFGKAEYTFQ